jgi:hypothetical protein
MHPDEFNPRSIDATLATILEKIDSIDKRCERIEAQTSKTNGRVNKLETWRTEVTAKTVVISGLVGLVVSGLYEWYIRKP